MLLFTVFAASVNQKVINVCIDWSIAWVWVYTTCMQKWALQRLWKGTLQVYTFSVFYLVIILHAFVLNLLKKVCGVILLFVWFV